MEVLRLEGHSHGWAGVKSSTTRPSARDVRVFVVIPTGEGVWALAPDGERVSVQPPCLIIFEQGESVEYGADGGMEEFVYEEAHPPRAKPDRR